MEILGTVGIGAFVLVSLIVGARLLVISMRTRRLPEFALGFGLFTLGGLDYVANLAARSDGLLGDDGRTATMIAAMHFGGIGILAVAVFTARVFRPQSRLAMIAVVLFAIALIGCGIAQGVSTGYLTVATREKPAFFLRLFNILQSAIMAWTAAESLHYGSILRRRLAIGLVDPLVADRVRLWGISASIASATYLLYAVGESIGVDFLASATGSGLVAVLGLAAAICIALAFLPPHAYQDWVKSRTQSVGLSS